MRRTVPPSAEIELQIHALLAVGVGEYPREALSELAKFGARLSIQRPVEDEFDAWLGRARYERRPEAPPGLRDGFRPRPSSAATSTTSNGSISLRTRTPGICASRRSNLQISSLKGSSFDGRSGHLNAGGSGERNAARIVFAR